MSRDTKDLVTTNRTLTNMWSEPVRVCRLTFAFSVVTGSLSKETVRLKMTWSSRTRADCRRTSGQHVERLKTRGVVLVTVCGITKRSLPRWSTVSVSYTKINDGWPLQFPNR